MLAFHELTEPASACHSGVSLLLVLVKSPTPGDSLECIGWYTALSDAPGAVKVAAIHGVCACCSNVTDGEKQYLRGKLLDMLAQDNNKVLQLCCFRFASLAGPSLTLTDSHRAAITCHPPPERALCNHSSSLCCMRLSALGLSPAATAL